jgi:hypothetical protein
LFSGHGLELWPCRISPGQEIVEAALGMAVDDAGKDWMGWGHFRTRRLVNVGTEMSLHVLAYNLKRAIAVLGVPALIAAMRG